MNIAVKALIVLLILAILSFLGLTIKKKVTFKYEAS
jgi:hypothetical protein